MEIERLILDESAVKKIKNLLDNHRKRNQNNDFRFRLEIISGGCSGFKYNFFLDSEYDMDNDLIIIAGDHGKYEVILDKTSLNYITKGAKLIYIDQIDKSGFDLIDNANVVVKCGCGVSFDLKMSENS